MLYVNLSYFDNFSNELLFSYWKIFSYFIEQNCKLRKIFSDNQSTILIFNFIQTVINYLVENSSIAVSIQ